MSKLTGVLVAALSVLIFMAPGVGAETYTCGEDGVDNSCTPSRLSKLIRSAEEGDTIRIAAGTHDWKSAVTVKKKVTISGGGSCPDCGEEDPSGTWSWPVTLNISGNTAFVVSSRSPGDLVRITGISFNGNGPEFSYTDGWITGIITEDTYNVARYRFDNLRFNESAGWISTFRTNGIQAYGVIDHVYLYNSADGGNPRFLHNTGHGGDRGDTDWRRPTYWGSENFVFVEDSTLFYEVPNTSTGPLCNDQQGGGRAVFRYNYLYNCSGGNHGTESGWPARSGVAMEYYGNEFFWSAPGNKLFTGLLLRGGSLYLHDNTFTNFQSMLKMWNNRAYGDSPGSSPPGGTPPYDGPGPPTGYPLIDQVGRGRAAGVGLAQTQPQAPNRVHIWNNSVVNTGGGGGCPNQGDSSELSICDPAYVARGREYEYSSGGSAAPAAYTPYPYPHPLTIP